MIIKILKKIFKINQKIFQYIYTKKILFQCKKCEGNLTVNHNSNVNKNTTLGFNVNFNGMKVKSKGEITIGNNFHSGEDCLIITDIHNYNSGNAIPYDNTYLIKNLIIEDNVWIGDRVVILGGITIGEGSIIQAGSVVTKDIPKYSIAGGHPATVFSQRNIIHYEKLKKEGKFH